MATRMPIIVFRARSHLRDVQALLGHKSIATTLYLALRALSFRDDTGSDALGQPLAIPRALRIAVVLRVGKEAELTEHSRASVLA